ncbi:LON peptidase substrate-binding domain-containing protein [Salinimonas sediminis]|uniref:Peptidase S16 n=1 Tax=Salinimonas sediminis TaxID=2303538 RepID=A0A346NNR6_9ALTE|nr:LON peptidase substrate-binding domain-containing protein [Salinimonas sediminis]AXR07173.1 peptidase S16 [Salinimonas sediminis]
MSHQNLPLFPLSAHLMPGGRMSLRIFEPRYIRMVKQVCANNSGFVMCMLNAHGDAQANQHIYSIGTFAQIIDFELLEDGLLGIKVAGVSSVEVENIVTESDGLRVGECRKMKSWQCNIPSEQISPMVERLNEIFERYPDLRSLYEQPEFENPYWVLNRWLELLPVDAKQKQYFLAQHNCNALLNYLSALV